MERTKNEGDLRLTASQDSDNEEALLAAYFPRAWREEQLEKSEVKQHWLYLVAFNPRFVSRRLGLLSRLTSMEAILASDPHATDKRAGLAGKLRTDEQYPHMMAELEEAHLLWDRATNVVYAPRHPSSGPDFECLLTTRRIEVEVTALTGTEECRLRDALQEELGRQLYSRPSGTLLDIACDWLRSGDDLTVAYRSVKDLLTKPQRVGEYPLQTSRGELRVYVRRTNLEPSHTYTVGHISSSSGADITPSQVVKKIRSKTEQIAGDCPAVVVLYVFPLLFGNDLASILAQHQHDIFELHPKVSAVVHVSGVVGEERRRVYRNPWAASALTDTEVAVLKS